MFICFSALPNTTTIRTIDIQIFDEKAITDDQRIAYTMITVPQSVFDVSIDIIIEMEHRDFDYFSVGYGKHPAKQQHITYYHIADNGVNLLLIY